MDRLGHVLVAFAFAFKKCTNVKKIFKYVVVYFNIFIFLAIIIDISIYFFLKFFYSSLQLLLLCVSELIFISSYVSYV